MGMVLFYLVTDTAYVVQTSKDTFLIMYFICILTIFSFHSCNEVSCSFGHPVWLFAIYGLILVIFIIVVIVIYKKKPEYVFHMYYVFEVWSSYVFCLQMVEQVLLQEMQKREENYKRGFYYIEFLTILEASFSNSNMDSNY